MKSYCIILFLLAWGVFNCYSQDNFYSGYIVKSDGDTLRCQIARIAGMQTPAVVTYRVNAESQTQSLTTSEVRMFCIEEMKQYYFAMTVKIDRKSIENSSLDVGDPNPKFWEGTIFLKSIIRGKVSLYQYGESNKIHYIIQKEDQQPEELLQVKYRNEAGQTIYRNLFVNQLKVILAGDCAPKDLRLTFSAASLQKTVAAYDFCSGSPFVVDKTSGGGGKKTFYIIGGIVSGGGYSSISTNTSRAFDRSTSVAFGAGLRFPAGKKTSVNIELTYKSQKLTGSHNGDGFKDTYRLGFSSVMANALLDFRFPGKIQPGFSVGLTSGFKSYNDNALAYLPPFGTGLYSQPLDKAPPGFAMGAIGGVHITFFKRVGFEVRYEVAGAPNLGTSNLYGLLRYEF